MKKLLLSILLMSPFYATTINVPADSTTIQAGINGAEEGDTVLVATGTYIENITWAATNGIKLIGSGVDDCIIDGDSLTSVIRFEEDLSGIIDSTTLITGFTIQNGYAIDSLAIGGGGIYLYGSSPSLINITISNNTANIGGGIFLNESSPSLINITISDNTANMGGGIFSHLYTYPFLSNVFISGNIALGAGGGVFSGDSGYWTNVTIIENNALDEFYTPYGGGGMVIFGNPTLTDVLISGNTSGSFGGGMSIHSGYPTITNVTITDNEGSGALYLYNSNAHLNQMNISNNLGSGINISSSGNPRITDALISNNTGTGIYISSDYTQPSTPYLTDVTISDNGGSGLRLIFFVNPIMTNVIINDNLGDGIFLHTSSPNLYNVVITNNEGAGMYLYHSNPELNNVTIIGNMANGDGLWDNENLYGGGMYLASSDPNISNTIIWGNSPESFAFSLYPSDMDNTPIITYSNIKGDTTWAGEGNINSDPLFTDPENGDYTLQEDSPCIDAGTIIEDMEYCGDVPDMGAYEYCEEECGAELGDVNGDLQINILDLVQIANLIIEISNPAYECAADYNQDGQINILDLVQIVNCILTDCWETETVCDYDGNCYATVQIGEQVWLAENLKVTHYNNGDAITHITNEEHWGSVDEGQYGVYDDEPTNANIYGNIYNWAVIGDIRGICPVDWHVPSDDEYTVLIDFLGGESVAGGKMKEAGLEHWNYDSDQISLEATNESGFTGLPAGHRNTNSGDYIYMGFYGYFWSSTENGSDLAWRRYLFHYSSGVARDTFGKPNGFSIRCLGD